MDDLGTKTIRSGFWSLGGSWLSSGLSTVRLIVLARLLAPADFGLLGMATLSIGILNVMFETGIESALIQKEEMERAELDTAWTIAVIRGLIVFLLLFASAGWIASYFRETDLKPALRVMAITVLISGFGNVGIVFLQKELRFKQKVVLDIISDMTTTASTIILAFWLKSVWALILGSIIWSVVNCAGSYYIHPYRPRICWDSSAARRLLCFGKHILWISLATFIVTSGDNALVGRMLGMTVLGFYATAYNIASLPVTSLAGVAARILFPAYSRLQNDPKRLREAFIKVLETILLVLLPSMVLLITLAEDFTTVMLGNKWMPMVSILQILCVLGFCRGLVNVFAPVQLAMNRPCLQSRNKTIEVILFMTLVYPCTAQWGVLGTSWAVTAVYMVSSLLNIRSSALLLSLVTGALVKACRIPFLAALGAVISAWSVHSWMIDVNHTVRLACELGTGLAVCGVITFVFKRGIINEVLAGLLRKKQAV